MWRLVLYVTCWYHGSHIETYLYCFIVHKAFSYTVHCSILFLQIRFHELSSRLFVMGNINFTLLSERFLCVSEKCFRLIVNSSKFQCKNPLARYTAVCKTVFPCVKLKMYLRMLSEEWVGQRHLTETAQVLGSMLPALLVARLALQYSPESSAVCRLQRKLFLFIVRWWWCVFTIHLKYFVMKYTIKQDYLENATVPEK